MERLKRTFTLRKKKPATLLDKNSKPLQWNDDERKVREGTCSFQVKYLGSIEVFESRGMPVCEEAMKQLLKYKSKKSKRAVLYVSGDALRVTEEISKGLIVDQVIEKVSFCAPDRNHKRGFAYICRDAATRRWLCHGFKAVKESGERLSHAVGCAFAVCLERKQQREKESVDVTFNENKTSFSRLGSFKQATITERLQDPQSVIIPDVVPNTTSTTTKSIDDQSSIPRPHASQSSLERQSSLRIFPKLQDQQKNPFKRDYSVRITDLSSNHDRKQLFTNNAPIKEESPDVKLSLDSTVSPLANHSGMTHQTSPSANHTIQTNKTSPPVNHIFVTNQTVITKPSVEKESDFSRLFEDDPFSSAPINPAAHIKHNNIDQRTTQSNFSHSNLFQQSLRQPDNFRPFNHVNQSNSNFAANNNQYRSFNNNFSTNWSDNIFKPVNLSNEQTTRNVPHNAKSSHHNPFDVSWVNHTTIQSNNNNNNNYTNNPFIC